MFDIIFIDVRENIIQTIFGGHLGRTPNPNGRNGKLKGAMRFGTFKSIDFKKNWYVKVPVVPHSLML